MQFMLRLRDRCVELKDKLSTRVKPEDNLIRSTQTTLVQVLDNNQVNWAALNPASVNTCTTCTYYYAKKVQDTPLQDEEEVPIYTLPPKVEGACFYLMPKYLIENVSPQCSCRSYQRRGDEFEDDMIPDRLRLW